MLQAKTTLLEVCLTANAKHKLHGDIWGGLKETYMRLHGTYYTIQNAMSNEFRALLTDDNFWKGDTWEDFWVLELVNIETRSVGSTSTVEQEVPSVPSALFEERTCTLEPTIPLSESAFDINNSPSAGSEKCTQSQADRRERRSQPHNPVSRHVKATVARNNVLQGRIAKHRTCHNDTAFKVATLIVSPHAVEEVASVVEAGTINPKLLLLFPSQYSQVPLGSCEMYSQEGSPCARTSPFAASFVTGSMKKLTESCIDLGTTITNKTLYEGPAVMIG